MSLHESLPAQKLSLSSQALHPAMSAWRKRLGFITERFEAAGKSEKLKELPALTEASTAKAAEEGAALDPTPILQAAKSVSESVEVWLSLRKPISCLLNPTALSSPLSIWSQTPSPCCNFLQSFAELSSSLCCLQRAVSLNIA